MGGEPDLQFDKRFGWTRSCGTMVPPGLRGRGPRTWDGNSAAGHADSVVGGWKMHGRADSSDGVNRFSIDLFNTVEPV